MARTWLSIRVELVGGGGVECWPRPGRMLAAARSHSFAQLATAIDDAFARWDHSHLHIFTLDDGSEISPADWWDDEAPDAMLDGHVAKLGRLAAGARFAYVFDLGDQWEHVCTVGPARIDPLETLGVVPRTPTAYFGWGSIPDQYGRRFDGDDGESPGPTKPKDLYADLPPLLPMWGGRGRR